ncbi:MAG TPA: FAD-dependent oxidoreductase, partial [Actinomycetes bacterium]|nr:FAD-dependent oxidoreductase [Actinomycetes bacterium]
MTTTGARQRLLSAMPVTERRQATDQGRDPRPDPAAAPERFETVIVGGGQAGLAVGHHLARRGRRFVILDAHRRIGDAWRQRWDSLQLFT